MLYQNWPSDAAKLTDEMTAHMNGRDKNRWIHSLETALPAYFSAADFDIILKQFLYDLLLQKARHLVPETDDELVKVMDDTIALFKGAAEGHPPSIEEWEVARLEAYALATSSVGQRESLADIAYGALNTDSDAPADTLDAVHVVLKQTKRNTTAFWRWAAELLLTLFRKAGVPQTTHDLKAWAA